jgi:hypothetical protein
VQPRPKDIPLAKADSKDKGQEQVHVVQQTGDALAWRLDGRTPDVQGAP